MNQLARKDWLEFVRDDRLRVASILVALVTLAAILLAASSIANYQRDVALAEKGDRETWLGQGDQNPHGAAHFASWAFRPLAATALLDPGVTPYAPVAIWMEAHSQNTGIGRPIEDRASTLDVGNLSLAWSLQTLMPLLIFVLSAGLVARERERGSLRLLFASNLTAGDIIKAKVRSLGRIVLLIVAPLLLIAVCAALLSPEPFDADQALRLALWCAVHTLYLAMFLIFGVAVSTFTGQTDRAMLILVGIWLLTIAIGPRLAGTIADVIAPTQSAQSFLLQIEEDFKSGLPGDPDRKTRRAQLRAETLTAYGVDTVKELPVSYSGISLDASEKYGYRIFDQRFADLYAQRDAQRSAMRWASLISPLVAVQNISASLAGTDELHHRSFALQAETHRRQVVDALNGDLIKNGGGKTYEQYNAGIDLWEAQPPFSYARPSLSSMLATISADILILVLWLLGAGALLAASSRDLALRPI